MKFDKFYVYESGDKPIGIIEGADTMPIDKITKIGKMLHGLGRYMTLKPIRKGDFDFDPISGQKIIRITKFEYPVFEPGKGE